MSEFRASNADFVQTVRTSFDKQGLMHLFGATLDVVQPGQVSITMPFNGGLTQQHGFFHAGAVTSIVDSACGYAALTLLPAGSEVLTIEYKVNFLAPASGEYLVARGRVLKPGRTVTVCLGEVVAVKDGNEKLCATMLATMINRQDAQT
ncbi:MAG: PaaI family thioesterase [Chloroflexota bacterium]|nr:PaaI family thioesterase [Chloroflexota bacterium]